MNCGGAPEVSSHASHGRTGVTELALLIAHERECADCRQEQVSAQVALLAHPSLTPSRALVHSLARSIDAARTGAATRVIDRLTRGRVALSTSMVSALTSTALASARITAAFRVGSAWLGRSARPLAQVPETVGVATARLANHLAHSARPLVQMPETVGAATARLANRLVQLHGSSVVRMRATARSTMVLQRGLLAGLADRSRTVAAAVILAARGTGERGVKMLARGRGFLTPETGFLLRVCAGIAGLGILAMALIFAWPGSWPNNHGPDKTSTGSAGMVSATKPRAEPETVEAASAPPWVALPIAPPVKEAVRTSKRRPTPEPESAAPAHRETLPLARESAAPDAPDPSAAIDWLLKGAGATSRRGGPTE